MEVEYLTREAKKRRTAFLGLISLMTPILIFLLVRLVRKDAMMVINIKPSKDMSAGWGHRAQLWRSHDRNYARRLTTIQF